MYYSSKSLTCYVLLQRYLIGGIFLCFSPRQKPLCKKDDEEAQPAPETAEKKEDEEAQPAPPETTEKEEKPNDVEEGAAASDEGTKAQVGN